MNDTPIPPSPNKIARTILFIFAVMFTVGILWRFFDIVTGDRFVVTGGRSNIKVAFFEDFWLMALWVIGAAFCWWAAFRVHTSEYLNKKIFFGSRPFINMKTGAIIGGIVGFCVGIGSLVLMNFPQFLSYLFLARVYDAILPYGNWGETLGWFYFIFSTVVGILYGLIVTALIKKLRK